MKDVMKPGTIGYIPPYCGHRTINAGNKKLIFFTIYPADAGHNYKIVEERNFAKIVVEGKDTPVLRKNPGYRRDKDAE